MLVCFCSVSFVFFSLSLLACGWGACLSQFPHTHLALISSPHVSSIHPWKPVLKKQPNIQTLPDRCEVLRMLPHTSQLMARLLLLPACFCRAELFASCLFCQQSVLLLSVSGIIPRSSVSLIIKVNCSLCYCHRDVVLLEKSHIKPILILQGIRVCAPFIFCPLCMS